MPSHTESQQRRRAFSMRTNKKTKKVLSKMNPFRKLMDIKRKIERKTVKRKTRDFDGIPDNELVMKADKRLSR